MPRDAKTKAERREARTGQQTKAERRQARTDRRRQPDTPVPVLAPARPNLGGGASPDDIESRLARIEQAVASQAERSEELLGRVTLANDAVRALDPPSVRSLGGTMDGELTRALERELKLRRVNLVPVDQPLALICQAQRSGGTLLARLFDGHPQCHAHPDELLIGDRTAHTWPELPLDEAPETWFAKLEESHLSTLFKAGRRKIPLKAPDDKTRDRYPFILPPAFQRRLFLDAVERRTPITSEREILDCYMTSLFNGWLDNQNLRGSEKRWVVAFSPRRAWGEGVDKLFELYPDGCLISILRDPLSWYSSALGRDPEAEPGGLLESWLRSAREMIEASRRYEERVFIVRFDDLLLDTPATMRRLAGFLEIDFDPVLTTPTFNGYPVGANSSYAMTETGVMTDPVERYKELLSTEQQELVRGECEELYQEALGLAGRRSAAVRPPDPPISLDTATVAQLRTIEGIGGVTAREIVAFRERRGGLASVEQLSEVGGIGPATMQALRRRLGA